MKKKVGLTAFIVLCLTVCYFVDRTANNYNNSPKTYGEYQEKHISKAASVVAEVAKNDNNVEKENASAVEKAEEEKEIVKRAYLTFDDGPSENTEKVLAVLDQYHIKATFFLIADQITPDKEALVKRMVQEGHVIGVHTYSHKSKEIYKNKEACIEDIVKTYKKIEEITGVKPKYYRFPYGSANCYVSGYCNAVIKDLEEMGLTYIDWNVTGEDSVGKPTEYSVMKNLKTFEKYIEPVILLHDGSSNKLTASILEEIVQKIQAAGYEFGTIEERSKPYQWPHNWQEK